MPNPVIYLDHNATTPLAPQVVAAIQPCLGSLYGNPSSPHPHGVAARRAVEHGRRQVANLLGCSPREIVFTSGGTEANNMAIKGAACSPDNGGKHIIISAVEHPAVQEPCQYLAEHGYDVTVVPVDAYGLASVDDVRRALRDDTFLVSIMHANNEVGTLQPIAEIASVVHQTGALMHTDAAQTPGKVPVDVRALCVDLMSIAGHKLYAPKGVGALYVRQGVALAKFMHGAGHEDGRRASTENLLGIVALGAACDLVGSDLTAAAERMAALRDHLWQRLQREVDDVRLNGHPVRCLPNTLSVGFGGLDATDLLTALYDQVAASAGSACHTDIVTISPVLQAMRVPLAYARGTLRFSLGRSTTRDEIDRAADAIVHAVGDLRSSSE